MKNSTSYFHEIECVVPGCIINIGLDEYQGHFDTFEAAIDKRWEDINNNK